MANYLPGCCGAPTTTVSKAALLSSSRFMSAAARVAFELLRPAGADDGGGDARLGENPGDTGRGQLSARSAEVFQARNRLELGRMPVSFAVELSGRAQREPRARRGRCIGLVLASEESAGQGVVDDHADSLVATEGQQFGLDVAMERIVPGLKTIVAGQLVHGAGAQARASCQAA